MNLHKFSPIEVDLEEGKNYAWCTCGHSESQPFCNGAHRAANATPPLKFVCEATKKAFLCTCKKTSNPPYCDGSHKS